MNFKDITDRVKSLLFPVDSKSRAKGIGMFLDGGAQANKEWLSLYNENPRLAVVHKIASDIGSTDFSITAKTKRSTYYVANHPLALEIAKHSSPNFFALWTAYLLMKGVVYIAFDLDNGAPTNFKIFTTIHLTQGAIGSKDEYEFMYGSEKLRYPASQVIVDTDLDLIHPYTSGKGMAEAIKDEIETDEFVQKYIKYFYLNSARPDVFITAEKGEEMTEADVARLEAEWLRKFQGVTNAHKPVFLTWAANVTSVSSNHKDMELLETRKFYRDTTIQHFGVPPEIMGIVENSNKATVIAAEHIYAKQVCMPRLHHIAEVVNTRMLPLYRDSAGMTFAFENIIPDDVELTLKIATEGLQNRVLTVNEWRVAMGYPRIAGEYGDSIVGAKTNAGAELPLPVVVEEAEIATREYKDYSQIVAEQFKKRAQDILGREIDDSNGLVIVASSEEEKTQSEKRTKKHSKV